MGQQQPGESGEFKIDQRVIVIGDSKLCGWCGRVSAVSREKIAVELTDAPEKLRRASSRPPRAAAWLSPSQLQPVL